MSPTGGGARAPAAIHDQELDALVQLARETRDQAERRDVDEVEVYIWQQRRVSVLHTGRLRQVGSSDGSGISVRVLRGDRLSFGKSSGLSEEDRAWAVDQAVGSLDLSPRRPSFSRFPEGSPVRRPPVSVDPEVAEADPETLVGMVERAEEGARRTASIDYFQCGLSSYGGSFAVVNSRGVEAWDRHAHQGMILEVRAHKDGARKFSRSVLYDRGPLDRRYELGVVAYEASQRAERATKPGHLDEAVGTAILDGQVTAQLLGNLMPAFIGRSALEGRSALSGKLGERVGAQELNLVDRPMGPGGCRRQRVDDEGIPTQDLPLVQDGILMNFLFDWASALETGQAPTGHGLRPMTGRYASPPAPKFTNLCMAPGGWVHEEIVEDTREAVMIRDALLGEFTMDHTTGDFSCVAPLAFRIEAGEVQDPLVSTTLAGNLFEVLENLTAIGDEPYRSPTGEFRPIRMEGITCVT